MQYNYKYRNKINDTFFFFTCCLTFFEPFAVYIQIISCFPCTIYNATTADSDILYKTRKGKITWPMKNSLMLIEIPNILYLRHFSND